MPHFQITILDWPGFGESDHPRLDYHPNFYRQFLQTFVQETFTQDVAVIAAGHAAGYALALESWSRIVLVAPTWRGPLAAMGAPTSIRSGVRGLVRSPLIGQALYGLNTRPGFLKWMYRRHVFVDDTQLTPDYIAERYQSTQKQGARYAPAAFVTGGLDPVSQREAFLAELSRQTIPLWRSKPHLARKLNWRICPNSLTFMQCIYQEAWAWRRSLERKSHNPYLLSYGKHLDRDFTQAT